MPNQSFHTQMNNRIAGLFLVIFLLTACSASSIKTTTAELGQESSYTSLLDAVGQPGVIQFEKHTAANWSVPLSGLLNLDHAKAVDAGLVDRQEDIQLYVYVITHPSKGTFLIDSGVSESFNNPQENKDVSYLVKKAMQLSTLEVVQSTHNIVGPKGKIDGVFLTHIHLDHIMGLRDLDESVPVYTGPGEASSSAFLHVASRGTTDRLLSNTSELHEWQFGTSGVVDVFADGSLWAIHTPGHSPGSTAFLVLTTNGPELIIGDATHTRWGWDNQVEPGSYSKDIPQSAKSLEKLAQLVRDNADINVHPGHQP